MTERQASLVTDRRGTRPGADRSGAARPAPPAGAAEQTRVGDLLREATRRLVAAGHATARQDAEGLLGHVLGVPRLHLVLAPDARVAPEARVAFAELVARRAALVPYQYLVGVAEFRGLRVRVGPGVFIPRPESEALVEHAMRLGPVGPAWVADLCSGSAAVACALATARPSWTIWATERAPAALRWARENVRALGLEDRVRVSAGDLFAPLAAGRPGGRWALVVANPPYLASGLLPSLPAEVRDHEPREALDGGDDGLAVVQRVLDAAPDHLETGGAVLVEIGEEHGPAVLALVASDQRYRDARVHRDFTGRDRVLEARRT